MELRQLTYFEAVVRCGGFTRAAEDLHVAQPAISAQIRRLEAELGVELLTRTTRRVALTRAGELLLARAARIRAELDGITEDLSALTAVLRGHVTLGASGALGPIPLPTLLAGFTRRHPGVSLTLRSGLIATLLHDLDEGRVDLVLGPVHHDLPARFHPHVLADEKIVLITPPGFPTGGRTDPGDLRGQTFVCLAATSGLRAILDAMGSAAGFTPQVRFEAASAAGVRDLVAAGLGVALLARSVALGPGPAVGVRELDPAPAHPPVGIIVRRDRRPAPAARALSAELSRGAELSAGRV